MTGKLELAPALRILAISLALACIGSANAQPSTEDRAVATVRALLAKPESEIDLARAKVTIDHLVDPSVDVEATLREIDTWVDRVRTRLPAGASNKRKVEILSSTLLESGPWNSHRPFGYDYGDPLARDLRNTMLSTYLATRKGQCVSMPIAFVVIGQKLGLDIAMTTAPYHLMAKYGDEERGAWMNLEATSGRFHPDSGYEDSLRIPIDAVEGGTYLRPHTRKESVALFATATLAMNYRQTGRARPLLDVTEAILDANPSDVVAMTLRADAHGMLRDEWYGQAERRGWQKWGEAEWSRYMEHFAKKKSQSEAAR